MTLTDPDKQIFKDYSAQDIEKTIPLLKQYTADNSHAEAIHILAQVMGAATHRELMDRVCGIAETLGYMPDEIRTFGNRVRSDLIVHVTATHGSKLGRELHSILGRGEK